MNTEDSNKNRRKQRLMPGGRGPMAMMGGSGGKANDFRGSMSKLIRYVSKFKKSIFIVLTFAIASTVFSIVSPKILGNITNQVVDDFIAISVYDKVTEKLPEGMTLPAGTTGEMILEQVPESYYDQIPTDQLEKIKDLDLSIKPEIDFESIGKTVIILIILYVISAIFNYLQSWIMTGVAQKVAFQLRAEVFKKINQLPLRYFDTHTIGDTLSRITNDVDTIAQTLNQSMTQIITSITMIIGITIMMLTISWQLTIVALLVLPLSMGIIGIIIKKSQNLFKRQADELGQINGHIEEIFSAHNIVKAYNGEDEAIDTFQKINKKLYKSSWKSQFLSGLLFPIMRFIGNLGYVLVATVGGWLAYKGKIGVGGIQAFIQYLQQFNQPLMQTANTTNILQSTAAAAERVFEFLEAENEIPEAKNPVELNHIKGAIRFDNISFSYKKGEEVINNLNINVRPGQRVAIVGPTGSGKTTLVNLLMRFYDVDSGAITVDGIDIRKVKRSKLRRQFGMVLQDTWLFSGTIKENIAYAKPDASDEEIIASAKAAQVDHFVHSLPKGYDMEIKEGSDNISQGEKQLLTIARAMLADSPVLILDEATSSVDTRTEILIQKAMDKLMEGRTSFVIAHRLSTIKNADLILVLRDGNIVEQGNHSELMGKKGFYSELYNSQFEE